MPQQIINFGGFTYVGIGGGTSARWREQAEFQIDIYGDDPRFTENVRTTAQSDFWPGAGRFFGESAALLVAPPDHSLRTLATGGNQSLGFSGITRDASNAPLGGVTVRLFRTVNSLLIASVVSAEDGSYALSTPYQGEDHFIVCHKSGAQEVAGASVSTLEPS